MKTSSVALLLMLCSCYNLSSQIPDSLKFQSLEPSAFQKKHVEEVNSILIDVREFFEFRKSRIKGAINIPSSGGFAIAADTINKENALFFYCYSGGRSKKANLFFYDKGFRNLYNLKGGITLWKKKRLPVVRKRLRAHGARLTTHG
jgi:thioredoxin 1